jgi:hypothetical protein
MSDYTVIRAVSKTLQSLLQDTITNAADPQLNGVPIDLRSPKEMRDDNDAKGISLWLYRVVRDGETLNQPGRRLAPNKLEAQVLPINLFYLVTPLGARPEDEQALLGRVLQVFYDHAILNGAALKDALENSSEELRLILETQTLEDLTRVWHALAESYQLSVTYQVQLARISSDQEPREAKPVLTRLSTYEQIS